jgi:hypothetical protein
VSEVSAETMLETESAATVTAPTTAATVTAPTTAATVTAPTTASNMTAPATAMTTASTAAVSIKAPPFITSNPSTWFVILEAQFHVAGITISSTRFYHTLASLPVDTVSNLDDAIIHGAEYTDLKKAVIAYHEASRGELFEAFLRETPLVGKPSHYLKEMRKVAKKVGVGDDMVRHRFQQALPPSLAPVIATQKTVGLDDLGHLADELVPLLTRSSDQVTCNMTRSHFSNHPSANSAPSYKPADKSRSPPSLGLVPFSENQRPKMCRSHIFFGKNARSCRPWCHWPDKSNCKVAHSRPSTTTSSRSSSPTRNSNM